MPLEVFYSYAHEDEELRNELDKSLALLRRRGLIQGWHDRRIGAGGRSVDEIDTHVQSADIILLLISADFVESDYCWGVEMKVALERNDAETAIVIPIILRPVDWSGAPFAKLQALPRDARAVTTWPNRDEALADIARGIREVVERFAPQPRSGANVQLSKIQGSNPKTRGNANYPLNSGHNLRQWAMLVAIVLVTLATIAISCLGSLPHLVRVSIPEGSSDANSHPFNGEPHNWSWTFGKIPGRLQGIGYIVAPAMDNAQWDQSKDFCLHDHSNIPTNSRTPDPSRARVTYEFDKPAKVTDLEVIEHAQGVSRVEGFSGDDVSHLISIGETFSNRGPIPEGTNRFQEGEHVFFAFDKPHPGRIFQFVITETSKIGGYAVYRAYPRSRGIRILPK